MLFANHQALLETLVGPSTMFVHHVDIDRDSFSWVRFELLQTLIKKCHSF